MLPGNTPLEKFSTFIATGFGLGLIAPLAPGTLGSLPGVMLALWTTSWSSAQGLLLQIVFALGMTFLAVPFCDVAERVLGKKDDGRICADEWMLFPICVIGIPLMHALWFLPIAFVVARLCDIIKPPPARGLQAVPGGAGIVIDDFVASLYALAINHALFFITAKFLA